MEADIPIGMHRATMGGIPRHGLPAGYSYRSFAPGDAGLWVEVQAAANVDFMRVTMETFACDFGAGEHLLPERSWFVVDGSGREVGSITAWWRDVPEGKQGLIHWVAVLPALHGKGIGKAMMTRAMERLALEYSEAYLNTSSRRTAAIKVYLDFGFVPDMMKERAAEGWEGVRGRLRHRGLGNL